MDETAIDEFEQRCHDYLEGRLAGDETSRFERELSRPRHLEVFRETLALRELLQSMGPQDAPEGLVERIQSDLGVAAGQAVDRVPAKGRSREPNAAVATVQASLLGLGWMLRGPAMAATAAVGSHSGGRETLSGLGTLRYSLGPLSTQSFRRAPAAKRPRKPLWRQALELVRR